MTLIAIEASRLLTAYLGHGALIGSAAANASAHNYENRPTDNERTNPSLARNAANRIRYVAPGLVGLVRHHDLHPDFSPLVEHIQPRPSLWVAGSQTAANP